MSGTTVHAYTEAGYSEYLPNVVLAKVADKAFHEIGVPQWSEEDYELAKAYDASLTDIGKEQKQQIIQKRYDAALWEEKNEKPLDTALLTFEEQPRVYTGGSTDVGDVGFIAPTVSINVATESLGTPGHSWQKTGQVGGPIGEKGMIVAAKVLALSSDTPATTIHRKIYRQKSLGGDFSLDINLHADTLFIVDEASMISTEPQVATAGMPMFLGNGGGLIDDLVTYVYSGKNCRLVHYDFYRLGDPGIMSDDLAESISDSSAITIIEWGDSIKDILPKNHKIIEIKYIDENTRELIEK